MKQRPVPDPIPSWLFAMAEHVHAEINPGISWSQAVQCVLAMKAREGDDEEGSPKAHAGDAAAGILTGHEGDDKEGSPKAHADEEADGSHKGRKGDEEEGIQGGLKGHEGDEEDGSDEVWEKID